MANIALMVIIIGEIARSVMELYNQNRHSQKRIDNKLDDLEKKVVNSYSSLVSIKRWQFKYLHDNTPFYLNTLKN